MDTAALVERIVDAVSRGILLSDVPDIPLAVFRDAFNRLVGSGAMKKDCWLLYFLGDQVMAQLLFRDHVLLVIKERKPRFYTEDDFAFAAGYSEMYGTKTGRYRFQQFVSDVIGRTNAIIIALLGLLVAMLAGQYMKASAMEAVSSALIAAMAIFAAMFVLFALSLRPELEYGIAVSDRLHRLLQSDTYVGLIAATSVFAAVFNLSICAALAEMPSDAPGYQFVRVVEAATLAVALVGTLLSFWIVLTYHMRRRQELTAITMAKLVIEREKRLANEALKSSSSENVP